MRSASHQPPNTIAAIHFTYPALSSCGTHPFRTSGGSELSAVAFAAPGSYGRAPSRPTPAGLRYGTPKPAVFAHRRCRHRPPLASTRGRPGCDLRSAETSPWIEHRGRVILISNIITLYFVSAQHHPLTMEHSVEASRSRSWARRPTPSARVCSSGGRARSTAPSTTQSASRASADTKTRAARATGTTHEPCNKTSTSATWDRRGRRRRPGTEYVTAPHYRRQVLRRLRLLPPDERGFCKQEGRTERLHAQRRGPAHRRAVSVVAETHAVEWVSA